MTFSAIIVLMADGQPSTNAAGKRGKVILLTKQSLEYKVYKLVLNAGSGTGDSGPSTPRADSGSKRFFEKHMYEWKQAIRKANSDNLIIDNNVHEQGHNAQFNVAEPSQSQQAM